MLRAPANGAIADIMWCIDIWHDHIQCYMLQHHYCKLCSGAVPCAISLASYQSVCTSINDHCGSIFFALLEKTEEFFCAQPLP